MPIDLLTIAFVSIYADKKTRRLMIQPRTVMIFKIIRFHTEDVIDIFAVDNPNAVFEIQGNEFLGKLNANHYSIYCECFYSNLIA
ncbi:MAG: hypothetical protein KatS3mg035_2007 [Bacteroidia bacterium]|nr:MAG: hypothetical protein KatS3mg035_2007 [Bacteroidia bacterium]